MIQNEVTVETLNDLIKIHNDRIEGYDNAIKDSAAENEDLIDLFKNLISESHSCKLALSTEVLAAKGETADGTTVSGKLHRAWMSVRTTFTGHDRYSILASCEQGEDATQAAYKSALGEEDLPKFIYDIIAEQQVKLKLSHDKIKMLRDMQKKD
ncbi:MAG: PA2169 family four-helix-bundle protein [Sphingobacteriaceae bacterium]|nr:MAG: PA2169 family four-helix-bundle protein [Sphingobacteriaceae bacterium]